MKCGKNVRVPLTPDVGESILDYLRKGRQNSAYPEVFLTAQAPFKPITNPSNLSNMIARLAFTAGIKSSRVGTHHFRHAFATRMLDRKQSLKSIADLLGHRRIQTSFIYTKVDFQSLNQVALEWPEEIR